MIRNQKTSLQKPQETGKVSHRSVLPSKKCLFLNFCPVLNCNFPRLEMRMIRDRNGRLQVALGAALKSQKTFGEPLEG